MGKIACIIVDDEPLALELLKKYVLRTSFLELVGQCDSATRALEMLAENTVQLIFLDIQMPELTGVQLSRIIDKGIKVIFTTAYEHYAVEGFRVNALDYLLKPINYEEFMMAAGKAREWFATNRDMTVSRSAKQYLFVRSEYRQIKIELNQVLYFEGYKDYIKIWLKGDPKPVLTLMPLKSLEAELPADNFMRIHRSFIVALDKIQSIERNHVVMNKTVSIVVADQYKQAFQDFVDRRSPGRIP